MTTPTRSAGTFLSLRLRDAGYMIITPSNTDAAALGLVRTFNAQARPDAEWERRHCPRWQQVEAEVSRQAVALGLPPVTLSPNHYGLPEHRPGRPSTVYLLPEVAGYGCTAAKADGDQVRATLWAPFVRGEHVMAAWL